MLSVRQKAVVDRNKTHAQKRGFKLKKPQRPTTTTTKQIAPIFHGAKPTFHQTGGQRGSKSTDPNVERYVHFN